MPLKKALYWTIFWISAALIFNLGVFIYLGEQRAIEFFTGYIVEESLSVDNLFIFLLLFGYFKIPSNAQRRILNWGIIGVIVLRGIFIFLGLSIVTRFGFIFYIFGAILIYSGFRMTFVKEKEFQPEENIVLKIAKKFIRTKYF